MAVKTTYAEQVGGLILDLAAIREDANSGEAKRELSLAITHLEDAQMRLEPSGRPDPGWPLDDLGALLAGTI